MASASETDVRAAVEAPVEPAYVTAEEFISWDQDEGPLLEWVDGRVIVHEMPKEPHMRIVVLLCTLLDVFVSRHRLGRVFIEPYKMRVTPTSPIREPDVLFISAEHRDRITTDLLVGPADLVVEVVSPDSTGRDRSDKFDEYEAGGVTEYWVIDSRPGHERADFWALDANGKYRPVPASDDGTYHSRMLPGFWLQTAWLWQPDANAWDLLQQLFASDARP